MQALHLDPDRLFPPEPVLRPIAREIFAAIRDLPLISMHGHVDAGLLARDEPFADPADLLVTHDHYVTRMLISAGVTPGDLGITRRDGAPVEADPRRVWRHFCAHWHCFRGTPSALWLTYQLHELFGVRVQPSAESADALYDEIAERLASPEYRPRALFDAFGLEVLATTDSPLADLAAHRAIAASPWQGTVVPTFRPDALLRPDLPGWHTDVRRLGELTGADTGSYGGYLDALRRRREFFRAHGARATDHGSPYADTTPLAEDDARRIYGAALAGRCDTPTAEAFAAHMLFQMARMSCEDGLVMQLHPGVLRDHDPWIAATFGPDVGFDIPTRIDFVHALRPLLQAFGRDPRLRCVVFTVDETSFCRELAPLAGVYPALRLGAPWWFLDAPMALRRFREAVTETAGFYNGAGFVDDTRAFTSIPARHDVARRVDAAFLAELVARGVLDADEAVQTAVDLTVTIPRQAYPPHPDAAGNAGGVGGVPLL